MRTRVGIVGAGPAGLLLAHLLHLQGIESIVLERQSRAYVERRIRAGVLEAGTVDTLQQAGLADRLLAERMLHHGLELLFDGAGHRIDLTELTGRPITIYGQHELVKDLIAARLAAGGELHFSTPATAITGISTDRPAVRFEAGDDGRVRGDETGGSGEDGADADADAVGAASGVLDCDLIAGCDGFHGICRQAMLATAVPTPTVLEHEFPYAWLGILAQAPPSSNELIYSRHDRGFALHSMRNPTLTRLYLQVPPDAALEDWPDERIWAELRVRLDRSGGFDLASGPIVERGIAPLRSSVIEPMQHGRLFLAGDAAHIVPATGAKGLNLAVYDVTLLSAAIGQWCRTGDRAGLESYSRRCLERVWRVQQFSWWMTSMLHRSPDTTAFMRQLQLAQLRSLTTSTAAATSFAEHYVGLPQ